MGDILSAGVLNMSGKIEYFKPKLTTDLDLNQAFLNQIIVPKISFHFFKKQSEALVVETDKVKRDKIIQLMQIMAVILNLT